MHSKSDNIETKWSYRRTFNRSQNNLEKSIKGSEFVFDYVHLFL